MQRPHRLKLVAHEFKSLEAVLRLGFEDGQFRCSGGLVPAEVGCGVNAVEVHTTLVRAALKLLKADFLELLEGFQGLHRVLTVVFLWQLLHQNRRHSGVFFLLVFDFFGHDFELPLDQGLDAHVVSRLVNHLDRVFDFSADFGQRTRHISNHGLNGALLGVDRLHCLLEAVDNRRLIKHAKKSNF